MTAERDLIIETTIRVAWYADRRLWDEIPNLFAEEVLLDYTSLTGGAPTLVAACRDRRLMAGEPRWAGRHPTPDQQPSRRGHRGRAGHRDRTIPRHPRPC